MQNQGKKPEKKQSKGGLIAVGVIFLLSIIDSLGTASGVAGFAIVGIILFFSIIAVIGALAKKKRAAAIGKKEEKKAETYTAPRTAVTTVMQERKYYDSDCEKMNSDHDHNRRLEQLDGFLKDGLISHEEYNILKEKYMR